ncbi:isoaspartyl dipeptidase IadA [Thermanaerovibrio velox DSM 12556]|uniref:Isoaspartyl dipeptidase n=1 Tax=Thermanaerovibrio velox DSM 12556 TaxID=926567 RepID=H0UQL1_9BACT|nr:beta-aspartyl-peptidase [Thermanaerovibrio velox]EHM10775.1 isoaspartyl dipeptidase IadA [Thermanaerovibrio velox DSM 12556]
MRSYLFKGAEVFAPEAKGCCDVLCVGPKVVALGDLGGVCIPGMEVVDGRGLLLLPGFIDNHVHILGGGGEGGPATRTPEMPVEDPLTGGITTVIGVLGTDDVTRSVASLVAKARGLWAEGISAWVMVGSYQLPVATLTGSIRSDIALVEQVIGVGEVALSDHRSSQPSLEELLKIASAARVGGMLKGFGGKVNVHMGDGPRGLSMLREAAQGTEIPVDQFIPTHVNRNPDLFREAVAFALDGGVVDLTTSTTPQFLEEGEVKCSRGLKEMLHAGVDPSRICFSSDGQGSLPVFDQGGRFKGLTVGRVTSLWEEVRDAVQEEGVPLETAVRVITSSPALFHRLPGKGFVAEGFDADLVLVDQDLRIRHVLSRGVMAVRDRELLLKGTFSPR